MAFIMKRNGSRISAAEVMDYTANHVTLNIITNINSNVKT